MIVSGQGRGVGTRQEQTEPSTQHQNEQESDRRSQQVIAVGGGNAEESAAPGTQKRPGQGYHGTGRQECADPVGLKRSPEITPDEQGETRGHTTGGTGLAGQDYEIARRQTQLAVRGHAAWCAIRMVRIQPPGDRKNPDQNSGNQQQGSPHMPCHPKRSRSGVSPQRERWRRPRWVCVRAGSSVGNGNGHRRFLGWFLFRERHFCGHIPSGSRPCKRKIHYSGPPAVPSVSRWSYSQRYCNAESSIA